MEAQTNDVQVVVAIFPLDADIIDRRVPQVHPVEGEAEPEVLTPVMERAHSERVGAIDRERSGSLAVRECRAVVAETGLQRPRVGEAEAHPPSEVPGVAEAQPDGASLPPRGDRQILGHAPVLPAAAHQQGEAVGGVPVDAGPHGLGERKIEIDIRGRSRRNLDLSLEVELGLALVDDPQP